MSLTIKEFGGKRYYVDDFGFCQGEVDPKPASRARMKVITCSCIGKQGAKHDTGYVTSVGDRAKKCLKCGGVIASKKVVAAPSIQPTPFFYHDVMFNVH